MGIRAFHARNYGCLRDVHVTMGGRLHAFVGPNDSGKSTLLRGIRAVLQFAGDRFSRTEDHVFRPFAPFPSRRHKEDESHVDSMIGCDVVRGSYHVELTAKGLVQRAVCAQPPELLTTPRRYTEHAWDTLPKERFGRTLDQLHGARMLHLEPNALRTPSALVPRGHKLGFSDDRGHGLPGVYQAILGRGDDTFTSLRDTVRALFPTVKRIAVVPVTRADLSVEVELADGSIARATELSDGMLMSLALATLPHLDPVSAVMIEEPERGLHPDRIKDVIHLLRDLAERLDMQVFLATHSPLVLDELTADEISVVTRPSIERGTIVTPLRATPHFDRRSKLCSLGELWRTYGNGEREAS